MSAAECRERHPQVLPVPEGVQRPFWSVMIPTYNRDQYLRHALQSVLAQDPGPAEMQIEVVDNASPDVDVAAIVRQIAGDRVTVFRQERNVGLQGNWNTCLQRARGRWIQVLCDDDGARPGFYETYRALIAAHPAAGLVFGRAVSIDDDGEWVSLLRSPYTPANSGAVTDGIALMLKGLWLIPPSVVVRREIVERVGGFDPTLTYNMDWELYTRVAAVSEVLYCHQPLALVREHEATASSSVILSGKAMEDTLRSLAAALDRSAPDPRDPLRRIAYRRWSATPAHMRTILHMRGEHAKAFRYALWLLRMNPCPGTALRALLSAGRAATSGVGRLPARMRGKLQQA